MNVVFCTDNNYIIPCGVAITSLLENNKGEDIKIFIIGLNLSKTHSRSFDNIAKKYNVDVEIIAIEESFLEKYDLPLTGIASSKYITLAAYIRLFFTDILPKDIDKILYLDCDLFILGNIRELYDIDLEEYSLAGVLDKHVFLPSIEEYYQRLEYKANEPYINSGILVINLKYWRENHVIDKFLSFITNDRNKIKYHDQDVINATLRNNFYLLPFKYNLQSSFYQRNLLARLKKEYKSYYDELISSLRNPVIIHFTTFYTKPWFKGSLHPMQKKYVIYQNMTEWKDVPQKWAKNTFSIRFKYYKRKFLYATRLKPHKYIDVA